MKWIKNRTWFNFLYPEHDLVDCIKLLNIHFSGAKHRDIHIYIYIYIYFFFFCTLINLYFQIILQYHLKQMVRCNGRAKWDLVLRNVSLR